jgi:2-iminobutanoate/2-iminopropanoate deaminase
MRVAVEGSPWWSRTPRVKLHPCPGAESLAFQPSAEIQWEAMTRKIITTDEAPKSALYSQAVAAGGLIFVSGQGPLDPGSGEIVGATIQEQTAQCLRNIEAILRAAGSSVENVVSATVILDDPNDFAGMNEEWAKWFPKDPPARQGARLPIQRKGFRVSIAAIAAA